VNVLDLFSGIGGFSLGLERAGMRTVAFCEIDPYARAVLKKHWPDVPCYEDVRAVTADRLRADGIECDVICGGFPCQDISFAGEGAGLAGSRSGLWSEYRRLVSELRPRHVIVENVAALLGRGIDRVLGDLAEIGYDAEWHCIPASALSAPHRRDRVWIIAYPDSDRRGLSADIARRLHAERRPQLWESFRTTDFGIRVQELAAFCGTADGLSARVDGRLHALGNAVVPQVVEVIGRAIMEAEYATVTEQPGAGALISKGFSPDGLSAPSNREP
jgi:DNA (cytosine-5)-methyltransferase 1